MDSSGINVVNALRIERGQASDITEHVANEVAVALVYNGISHAVMMCTPCDLEDFAVGFSLSEGIVNQPREIIDIDVQPTDNGISIDIRITEACFQALKATRRALVGRTGCGLCGVESLDAAVRLISQVGRRAAVRFDDIQHAIADLGAHQPLNELTGAVHAAAYWNAGTYLIREDVGRHNALDKLIGALPGTSERHGVLLMSSRASYELVYKAAAAGIEIMAAISAPTAMAIQLANAAGMTLIGFARDTRMTVYTHPARVLL